MIFYSLGNCICSCALWCLREILLSKVQFHFQIVYDVSQEGAHRTLLRRTLQRRLSHYFRRPGRYLKESCRWSRPANEETMETTAVSSSSSILTEARRAQQHRPLTRSFVATQDFRTVCLVKLNTVHHLHRDFTFLTFSTTRDRSSDKFRTFNNIAPFWTTGRPEQHSGSDG